MAGLKIDEVELLDKNERVMPRRAHRLSFSRNATTGGIRVNGRIRHWTRLGAPAKSIQFDFDISSIDTETLRDFLIDACARKKLRDA